MITIHTNADEFKRSIDQFIHHLEIQTGAALESGLSHAKEVARTLLELQTVKHTGNLMAGIETSQSGPFEGKLFDLVGYSGYVEGGTAPHDIYPVKARFLRFVTNGTVVFARHVHHPGTKARPHMWPAAISGGEWAATKLAQAVTE